MTAHYIDLHLLQTIPFANLNRDDLGAPKRMPYGGHDRTRVSSQCWKRPVRHTVETRLGDPAHRTRRIVAEVADRLHHRHHWPPELAAAGGQQIVLSAAKASKTGQDGLKLNNGNTVLLWLPAPAFDDLADLAADHRTAIQQQSAATQPKPVLPTSQIVAILKSRTGTINLFGRMLAEIPDAEVDGAVQVAHAFTTHTTTPEVDFFTAVDDLNPAGQRGSGHMESAEFSAGVFYRYTCIDVAGLLRNLDDDATAAELTREYLAAFISALPTGKKNSTAPNTLPDLAYLAVRTDRPLSLAPAFEAPVRHTVDGGWAEPSRRALADYATRLHRLCGIDGIALHAHAGLDDKPLDGLGDRMTTFADLIAAAITTAYPHKP